jgi:hypothetical protein
MTVILDHARVCITAPAGTGKTHLIIETLRKYTGSKPLLILTHTNAGVHVLRRRLSESSVPKSRFQVQTIDGFALLLVRTFPMRAGYQINELDISYPAVRAAAANVLAEQHIDSILKANFARVIVDEYQDCDITQHGIVVALAELIPTAVLGDPLQRIFGFKGSELPAWDSVQATFVAQEALHEPQRWMRAGNEELGQWLLSIRPMLQTCSPIDLNGAPRNSVLHFQSSHEDGYRQMTSEMMSLRGKTLVIGDSTNDKVRHELARRFPGASIVEPVDLKCLMNFACSIDTCLAHGETAELPIEHVVAEFATSLMTGVNKKPLLKRLDTIRGKKNTKSPTHVEAAGLKLIEAPSYAAVKDFLEVLRGQHGARLFRPSLLRLAIQSLQMASQGRAPTLFVAAKESRERNRHFLSGLPIISIGSTLLLKGLEAENAAIVNADKMSAENLYVALTRGSRKVLVRSRERTLVPLPPRY